MKAIPTRGVLAEVSAAAGKPLYDEDTPIGVEVVLGPELIRSVIGQMNDRVDAYVRISEGNRDRSQDD